MKKCGKCGKAAVDEARFCPACGTKFPVYEFEEFNEKIKPDTDIDYDLKLADSLDPEVEKEYQGPKGITLELADSLDPEVEKEYQGPKGITLEMPEGFAEEEFAGIPIQTKPILMNRRKLIAEAAQAAMAAMRGGAAASEEKKEEE